MSFRLLGPSKLRVLTLIAILPVLTARCAADEKDVTAAGAGDSGEEGGAPPTSGASATGGTTGAQPEPSGGGITGGTGASIPGTAGSPGDASAGAGGANGDVPGGEGEGGGRNSASSAIAELPNAEFSGGDAPATNNASNLPAISSLMGSSTATNGGTTTVRIELDGKPESPTFIVFIEGDSGYFIATATDANADGIYEIEIRIGAEVDLSTLTVRIAPIDAQGNVGVYETVEYELVKSGVGEVKVTLSFDRDADLDLHVIEPNGFEVFFDTHSSPTGGELDLDSNANCVIDGKNTENVFWPPDGAPDGTYQVWVEYFATCGVTEDVGYTVTLYNGPSIETFRGTFEPASVEDRRLITSFVH